LLYLLSMLTFPFKYQLMPCLKNLQAIFTAIIWACCGLSSTFAQKKPNMVIFIADDLNQQDIGCYGNTDVKTPNMDMLAAEGMRFNRAYAASPMCAPSRSVMFTGLYPFRNGSQMNHFTVRPHTRN